ncbi:MAG: isoaspartyl peptidase/L-asparaginase [Bacteroidetes bacterium]|nr:isoaspartyl peptidase/L-asparaginase [Bacteroidota bacterium]MBV6460832.1 Isoaspartyl peptidase [Flavobacteriales bacterium]MCL4816623.1 isoaspartyl peptidase/L-asparaginase [Flavobacteriales bacterium]NOG95667.1 isoaspartyl peptidase/L-asparaginase [Bacteroidota bacterium]
MNYQILILILLFIRICVAQKNETMNINHKYGIVLHGGAGTILRENMNEELETLYIKKLQEALDSGYAILEKNGSALDAVTAAVNVMENSPLFNAGKGSVFSAAGKNEMDASIMDGRTLQAGAVASVTKIKNPITAARCVMEKSAHVLLMGTGAEEFAKEKGIELVEESYFFDEMRWKQFQKIKEIQKIQLDHSDDKEEMINPEEPFKDEKFGTVGAVALDKHGNLAAGTSTGGMTNKKFGRVGDSPIIGAGNYANNTTCAVSCTGHGEYFIRNVVAYDVAALIKYKNYSLQQACNEVINIKLKQQGGEGGLIAIDKNGNIQMPFNTKGMYRGYKLQNNQSGIFIFE